MAKCRNCGMEHEVSEVCVFATYKTNIGGVETMVCCERCAPATAKPAAVKSPAKKVPAKKAPKKKSRKAPKRKSSASKKIKKAGKKRGKR